MFKIFRTEEFDKKLLKNFSKTDREQIENFEKNQLVNNPYIGDPLGYKFFREKRIKGKRVYFLIYDDLGIVLMVDLSDKKTQQKTIEKIKENLEEYYKAIRQRDESYRV